MRLKALLNNELNELNESSLSRLLRHIEDGKTKSWAMLTSWRKDNTENNDKDFEQLKNTLKSMKLGYIRLLGYGQEKDNRGNVIQAREPSLFIINISYEHALRFSDRYKQWGFIYSGPENNHEITLYTDSGKSKESMGSFHPQKIAQFYSKIKGKTFVFEEVCDKGWFELYSEFKKNKVV